MKQKNLKARSLTPEQEAELLSLFRTQYLFDYRIVAPLSNVLSTFFALIFVGQLQSLDIEILLPLKSWLFDADRSIYQNDVEFSKYHYRSYKEAIAASLSAFSTKEQELLRASGLSSMKDYAIMKDSISKFEQRFVNLPTIKRTFAEVYRFYTCIDLQQAAKHPALKCYYSSKRDQSEVITTYSKKTVNELYTMASNAIKQLQQEVSKYPSDSAEFPCAVVDRKGLSPLKRYLFIRDMALLGVTTVLCDIFLTRSLVVKWVPYIYGTREYSKEEILALTDTQAHDLILKLKKENKHLPTIVKIFEFYNFLQTLAFLAYFLNTLITDDQFHMVLGLFMANIIIILLKDIIYKLHHRYLESNLESGLKKQQIILNSIAVVSHQDNWTINKGISLDTSYLVLNRFKMESAKATCEAIKYALLINGINIIADDRDCIIVSGNEKLDQKRVGRAVQNISETLDRLEKLRKLKQDYLTLAKPMGGKYNFHMKRDKNHSIVSVFKQEIPPEYQDIITLAECTTIFKNHRIRIKENKLIIVSSEPLGSALREYQLLFANKKMQKGLLETSSGTTASAIRRPPTSPHKGDSSASPARIIPSAPRQIREVVKWWRDYTYDSQNPNCQIYKFFSSGKNKLFVISKLSAEDFADQESYSHYEDKVKDPTLASEKKGQGFVKVPDLCARDRHGNRFFARWKYRFLGAMGDKRPICEELKAATGEKLLVVRAVSDHKAIERMQKGHSKTI